MTVMQQLISPTSPTEGLAQAYHTHAAAMRRRATRVLNDPFLAEDAVHEVFRKLPHDFLDRVPTCSRGAYLCRAACHEAIRIKKHEATMAAFSETGMRCMSFGPLEGVVGAGIRELLRTAINDLPQGQRAAVQLTALSGFTRREAAESLGISLSALEKRMTGAYRNLRRILTARGNPGPGDVSSLLDGGG